MTQSLWRSMTRDTPLRLAAALSILLTATLSAGATEISLSLGGQHLLETDARVTRLAVGDPEIADVQILSAREVRILGAKSGTTDLMIWQQGSDAPLIHRIVVGVDFSRLKTVFANDPELADIEVRDTGKAVILAGHVPSVLAHDRAVKLAKTEFGDAIVDFITVGQKQMVAVEVRFAAVSVTAMQALGINLNRLGNSGFQFATGVPNSIRDFSFGNGGMSVEGGLPISRAFNLLMAWPGADFMGVISALSNANLAQMLAKPTLLVRSGEEAHFLAGGQIPVPVPQVGGGGSAVAIEYRKYGVQLNLKATVLSDQRIVINVNPEVSELDPTNAVQLQGFNIPAIKTRSTNTTIELGDGQSFVLAGLMYSANASIEDKLPGVGDLPVIGSFFRQTQQSREQQELIIIATPRLVSPMKPGEAPALPGEDVPPHQPSISETILGTRSLERHIVEHGVLP